MFETVVWGVLFAVGLYLAAGVLCALPLQRWGLARIDPAAHASGWGFRILITPGLATFWPLLLWRWRQALRREGTAGAPETPTRQAGLRRWQRAITITLLILCPGITIGALLLPDPPSIYQPLPSAIFPEGELLQHLPPLGRIFPSLPATILIGRTSGREYGLEFRFEKGGSAPPAAFYWAPGRGEAGEIPPDARFISIVWPTRRRWYRFPDRSMVSSGYFYLYYFTDGTVDITPARYNREERFP